MNEMMIWKPHVTVASVVEQDGKFLLVEENISPGEMTQFNQPAGHLEAGESLIEAAIRETLEETGYIFTPEWLVGVYHWHSSDNDTTYLRFSFSGNVSDFDPNFVREACIVSVNWYDLPQIEKLAMRHRSPLVQQCIRDYLSDKRYPLEVLTHHN